MVGIKSDVILYTVVDISKQCKIELNEGNMECGASVCAWMSCVC